MLGAARRVSWLAVLLGVIPVACSLTTHGDDYVEGGASGGEGTPGASGSSTSSGVSGPGSTTTGASTTGGGGGSVTTGMGGAGGASNASSSGDSSSSSSAGTGGDGGGGGGPVEPCGNGIIEGDEECDDMNSEADTFCTGCQITCQMGSKENQTTHHCYGHSGAWALNWAGAKQACVDAGGHLATITDQTELDWILDNFPPPTDSYLGGSDMALQGTFAWITNEPWTWPMSGDPWDNGEPNNSGDCLQIKEGNGDTGEFDDVNCALLQPFYCEREPAGIKP